MLISDISHGDAFRKSCLIENTEQTMISHSTYYSGPSCYTLTTTDFNEMDFRDDYFLITTSQAPYSFDNQFNLISLSRALFKHAKQLEGPALTTLNRVYSKGFSDKPTRL